MRIRDSKITSIQIGSPRELAAMDRIFQSGIYKESVVGPQHVSFEGIEKDYVGGHGVHGGPLRALYICSQEGYANWKGLLPDAMVKPGMFGENIALTELPEAEIFVGDIFELGETIIQATIPRTPCILLEKKFGRADTIAKFYEFGRPGIYFKVLQPGAIQIGDSFRLRERSTSVISQLELFRIYERKTCSPETFQYLMQNPMLTDIWKQRMEKWDLTKHT